MTAIARPTAPLRFLVVEDEALLAMDMSALIEDLGHVVIAEAACLREVEEITGVIEPQVALVDLQLAEGSTGIEVCAHIRRHWTAAIVVFVTANPKRLPGDLAGAHGVIAKPFSQNGLTSTMRYLTECVCDPPPLSPRPAEFTASDALRASWSGPNS